MKRIGGDTHIVGSDPFLVLMTVVPLLMIMVIALGTVPLLNAIEQIVDLDQNLYTVLVEGIIVAMMPLLLAIAPAFIILEERDGGLIQLYDCSPVGYRGILRPRLVRIIGIQLLYALVAIVVFRAVQPRVFGAEAASHTPIFSPSFLTFAFFCVVLSGIDVAIWTLLIVRFAPNKIVGLSLTKALSITAIVPLIHAALVVTGAIVPWVGVAAAVVLAMLPGTWIIWSYLGLSGYVDPSVAIIAVAGVGILLHLGALRFLYRTSTNGM